MNLNLELINNFRRELNKNKELILKLRNENGKNRWNILCSAMDWITICAEGIKEIKIKDYPKHPGRNAKESLDLMQYVVTIDLIHESIVQIYRVLQGNNIKYPLHDNKEVFNQTELSDDLYFKHVRAVFGTHPVNLNSVDGVVRNKEERFFGSWSIQDIMGERDYIVFLYSNQPINENGSIYDDMYEFSVKIDDLEKYIQKRYNLLNDLILKLK